MLVSYVQAITTATRGLFGAYCRYTVIIATFSYQYCSCYIISRYTCVRIFADIVHWPTIYKSYIYCFILNCHRTLLFSQILILFICAIFEPKNLAADKEIRYLRVLIIKNCRDQVSVTKPSNHWSTEHYQGSDDSCEGDLDQT